MVTFWRISPHSNEIYSRYFFTQFQRKLIFSFVVLEGNKKINCVRTYYGFNPLDESSLVLVNLWMTYAIVKILLPLRIGLSLMLKPWLAAILTCSLSVLQRLKIKFFSKQIRRLRHFLFYYL